MNSSDRQHINFRFKDYFDIDERFNLVGYDFEDIDNLYEFIDLLLKEKNSIIDSLNNSIILKEEKINTLIDTIEILKNQKKNEK